MNLKGICSQPRRVVTDATHRLCDAIKANGPKTRTKFVLMNTTGNRNRDLHEPISFLEFLAKRQWSAYLPRLVRRSLVGKVRHFLHFNPR